VHWRGDEGFVAGLNYWGNVENAFYVADDLAELVNGISGNRIIIAHSLGNMVAGSAIQDFGMGFDKYFMLNPAVALEAYSLVAQPIQMRHPDWDEYYFGDDYNASLDTENYSGVRTDGKNGRRLWSTEWYTLLPSTDERYKLTWRNRFASVSASTNVIQYYSSGEEVLRAAQPGEPDSLDPITGYLPGNDTPIGLNAWNIQEKSKGTGNLAAFLGGGASVGWGFNEECETDQFGNEVCIPNNFLTHNLAQAFFDKTDDELVQTPFFDPFDNLLLMDINAGSAAVGASLPHNLAYEIPALSFAAGGTVSQQFFESGNTVDMNNEMFDGWPASRGGVDGKEWWHSDFKDVSYRYTYKLFNDIVSEGSLQ